MSNACFITPATINEPVLNYAPGSAERIQLKAALKEAMETVVDIPMYIDGKEVRTTNKIEIHPPHNHQHLLGHYYEGDTFHVKAAIEGALRAKKAWAEMPFETLLWKVP